MLGFGTSLPPIGLFEQANDAWITHLQTNTYHNVLYICLRWAINAKISRVLHIKRVHYGRGNVDLGCAGLGSAGG
jgi:hypothetical protein